MAAKYEFSQKIPCVGQIVQIRTERAGKCLVFEGMVDSRQSSASGIDLVVGRAHFILLTLEDGVWTADIDGGKGKPKDIVVNVDVVVID